MAPGFSPKGLLLHVLPLDKTSSQNLMFLRSRWKLHFTRLCCSWAANRRAPSTADLPSSEAGQWFKFLTRPHAAVNARKSCLVFTMVCLKRHVWNAGSQNKNKQCMAYTAHSWRNTDMLGTCGNHMNMQVFVFKTLAVLLYSYCFVISLSWFSFEASFLLEVCSLDACPIWYFPGLFVTVKPA